jgi:hypothetical protein
VALDRALPDSAKLYTDKKNVHVIDEKTHARAADSGEEVWTHFGWACKQLGIEIITAHSPEAKGRVERNHGIYQDQLVKELRLAGINTIGAASEFLAAGFCEQLNRKFAVAPRSAVNYHRSAKGYNLAQHLLSRGRTRAECRLGGAV